MYVCMYACMHVCMYVHTYVFMHVCICINYITFSVPMSAIFLMSCAPHMAPTGMYTPWGCGVKQIALSTAGSARIVGEPICKGIIAIVN